MSPKYDVRFSKSAKRALTDGLPEKVAAAAFEFITGALSDNPQRVGKQLLEPLFPLYSARRGDYRIIYRILDDVVLIDIVSMAHRRDAYR
ncbi:type II toxin-antitoxin system RelE/ParE family toxin [Arthrobacter sp. UYEF20]|uniref:type II toxin-antitoxin system RelE family toxin n=1 Tax=Arthrobacter sp. UYEF20 TaxID=1756363 RepID=UPI00339B0262